MKQNSISKVAALLMLAFFALSVLAVLLSGAKTYQSLTEKGTDDYARRTCLQFISTKLKQAPAEITIGQFGDGDSLVFPQQVGSRLFVTRIYCYDGWLMELYSLDSPQFRPEDGEKILPLDSLSITRQEGLITVQACREGTVWLLHHSVRRDAA